MSKTIEFVGENIKDIKISIEGYKRLKTFYLSQENYEDCVIMSLEQNIKYLENKLSVWEPIKAELEAWEIVKSNIVEEDNIIDRDIKVIKVKCQLYPKGESNGKYEIIKKAMEVE